MVSDVRSLLKLDAFPSTEDCIIKLSRVFDLHDNNTSLLKWNHTGTSTGIVKTTSQHFHGTWQTFAERALLGMCAHIAERQLSSCPSKSNHFRHLWLLCGCKSNTRLSVHALRYLAFDANTRLEDKANRIGKQNTANKSQNKS